MLKAMYLLSMVERQISWIHLDFQRTGTLPRVIKYPAWDRAEMILSELLIFQLPAKLALVWQSRVKEEELGLMMIPSSIVPFK